MEMTIDTDDLLGICDKKPDRYYLVNEAGTRIAWFSSLDTAACVLRYFNCRSKMTDEDIRTAHEAMQNFDLGLGKF